MNNATGLGNPGTGLLSVKQSAAYLNVSESYLYQSLIPHVHIGRRRLYRLSDLNSFIEQNLSHHAGRGDQ
jgi:excisionase family DNA binding protein